MLRATARPTPMPPPTSCATGFMGKHFVRRSDGKYLAQEERGGFFWTDVRERAAQLTSEADARQFIAIFAATEKMAMEPEPLEPDVEPSGRL